MSDYPTMTSNKSLNKVLIKQFNNHFFYEGKVTEGAKELTKEVSNSLGTDRCSIWLYNSDRSSIICQELYIKEEDTWYENIELFEKDFKPYFKTLEIDPIIIANDVETHPATSCFLEVYLKPLGIKSMLDVPIYFKGEVVGVICIESLTKREWGEEEIDFAQILASLYTFAIYSKENFIQKHRLEELEKFVNQSALVSKTDKFGNITYVNEKFTEVSGWTLEECLGKNHNIVNSGYHSKDFWREMYDQVVNEKKIWNKVVTNRTQKGSLYHVDSHIKAEFDSDGNLSGFISIRQDVTNIVELNDKLNNLLSSQTSYVLRTDMQGRHTYWNQKFEEEFGWVYEGKMMHGDSLLSICESHHNAAREAVYECIKNPGQIVKVELDKPHKDGSRRTTLWEFVCLVDGTGHPFEVQCMGIDISDRVRAEKKLLEALEEVERKDAEIKNRMNAINNSNAVIEFDLDCNIIYANDKFAEVMGYDSEEIKGKHHKIFLESEYANSEEYTKFCKSISSGKYFSGQVTRVKKDGSLVYLQATYNPIFNKSGEIYRIMKIATDVTENYLQRLEIEKKNTYLEHAAKIIRHDMHSGINTYIPRGISSLDRRMTDDEAKNLKIDAPLRMIREGLKHAQKVYRGVYEFTNLVKKDVCLTKTKCNIKDILEDYLSATSYKSQVNLDNNLPTIEVNESLFCTSIDNLIRNGLKYNDSDSKIVKIYGETIDGKNFIIVEDNGRGMTQDDFDHLSKPYVRKEGQKETGTGLGLNICKAILDEHGFEITAEKLDVGGTKLKIKYA